MKTQNMETGGPSYSSKKSLIHGAVRCDADDKLLVRFSFHLDCFPDIGNGSPFTPVFHLVRVIGIKGFIVEVEVVVFNMVMVQARLSLWAISGKGYMGRK